MGGASCAKSSMWMLPFALLSRDRWRPCPLLPYGIRVRQEGLGVLGIIPSDTFKKRDKSNAAPVCPGFTSMLMTSTLGTQRKILELVLIGLGQSGGLNHCWFCLDCQSCESSVSRTPTAPYKVQLSQLSCRSSEEEKTLRVLIFLPG